MPSVAIWDQSSSSSAPTHQLKRLARRATLGMARTGGLSGNGSGDIFLAFSTANPEAFRPTGLAPLQMVSNEQISGIFDATAYATEEAIINAMVAAETMTGANNRRVERLPHDGLRAALQKYNRLAP
jgi:D-aminopeptidase